jgi:hypothetical protein
MSAVAPACTASSPAFCRARALRVPLDTRFLRGQQNDSARGSCSSRVLISQKPANACAKSTVGSHSQVMLVSAILLGYCGAVRRGRAAAVPGAWTASAVLFSPLSYFKMQRRPRGAAPGEVVAMAEAVSTGLASTTSLKLPSHLIAT